MKKYFSFFLFALFFLSVQAQVDPSVKYAEMITAADLRAHLTILASDFYEGRETATKGQTLAADYISKQFKNAGIPSLPKLNGYYQNYPIIKVGWQPSTIAGKKEVFTLLQDFYGFAMANNSFSGSADEIVFLGYGIDDSLYSDYRGMDVKDKVVMVAFGEPVRDGKSLITGTEKMSDWSKDWRKKVNAATEHGARCILVVQDNVADIIADKQWHAFLTGTILKIKSEYQPAAYCPNFFISTEMAKSLLGKKNKMLQRSVDNINRDFVSWGFTAKTTIVFNIQKLEQPVSAQNVLGYVEGSDLKDQLIIVSAHYDHLGKNDTAVFNGADDDGSGTVALIEMATALMKAKANGDGPRRSVLFLAFSGEEKGLLGSKSYVADPVFPLDMTVADLNIDMIGRIDEKHAEDTAYVYIIGSDFLSTELHRINEAAAKNYSSLKLDYTFNSTTDPNRFYYRSDHYNFAKNNIPVIFYFNGTHADYHQTTDDVDKIHFELMAERAQLVFHTLWMLANQDNRIKVDVTQ